MRATPPGDPVGVLGGTFDPVHLGHLRVAEATRERLALTRVLLVPTAVPPHKPQGALSPAHHRAAMLDLALAGRTGLGLCTIELDVGRVAYSIDTLRALRDGAEACRPLFILGTDALLQLHSWRSAEGLVAEFDLVAVDRADHPLARFEQQLAPGVRARLVALAATFDAAELERLRPGAGGRIFHFPLIPSPISSSTIRERARAGGDLEDLVPAGVAQYIHRMGLYRRESRS